MSTSSSTTAATETETKKIVAAQHQGGETGGKKMSAQEIVDGFRKLREEQRQVAAKMTELEMDRSENKLVIETLEALDADRKCFRLIGGVLVERTVKEVLPAMANHLDQLAKLIDSLQKQLVTKGEEINEYRDKYNIRIQGEDLPGMAKSSGGQQAGDAAVAQSTAS